MTCVNLDTIKQVYRNMAGRVRYDLGGKAADLEADSHAITEIDCSGFVRFCLYRAVDGAFSFPDGSVNQHEWCEKHWRKLGQYGDVQYAANDTSRLFVAFLAPHDGHPGHVFFICGGRTLESHGGAGVDSRRWDTGILMRASACYEVPVC